MDELIVKYLLNEATPKERQEFGAWRASSEENNRYFEQIKLIWSQSKQLAKESDVDENAAWLRFKQSTEGAAPSNVVAFQSKKRTFSIKAAAAVLVLVFGTWMTYYLMNNNSGMALVSSNNNILIDTLPDGSIVTLNKNSSIAYPKNFTGNTRAVTLEGEAFFDVMPDKEKPFIIEVDDVDVTVVGTSFNIKSGSSQTEITVETGVVTVAKKENMVKVLPKQRAIVSKNESKPQVASTEDNLYNYYRTKEFVCNNTPLWKLIEALNTAYQANIIIENKNIKNLPLTTTFKEDSLNEILNTVVQTFNITIAQRDGKIILK